MGEVKGPSMMSVAGDAIAAEAGRLEYGVEVIEIAGTIKWFDVS
jgi:hypothetical protein